MNYRCALARVKRTLVCLTVLYNVLCLISVGNAQQSRKRASDWQARSSSSAKFALLIGINQYEDPKLPRLAGSVNDAEDMRKTLQDVYAFDPANILLLTDRSATRQAILDGFRKQLIENARKNPNAIVFLLFSGIGIQVNDLNGDEPDGRDEAIVPFDARQDSSSNYITDDQLDELLAELSKLTSNATVVYDTNFGADVSRVSERSKGIRTTEVSSVTSFNPLSVRTNLRPRFNKSGFVTISATSPGQNSYEINSGERDKFRRNGALTFALISQLRENPVTTYRELMQRVSAQLLQKGFSQTPQADGDIDRLFLSGLTVSFDVKTNRSNENQIILSAGTVHGITKGVPVILLKPQSNNPTDVRQTFAEAIVVEATASSAVAELKRKVLIPPGTKALFAPRVSTNQLRVAFDETGLRVTANGEAVMNSLTESFSSDSTFVRVDTNSGDDKGSEKDKSSDVLVAAGQFGKIFAKLRPQVKALARARNTTLPNDSQDVFYLTGTEGQPLFGFFVDTTNKEAAARILEALRQAATQRSIKGLYQEGSYLNKALEVTVERLEGEFKLSGLLKVTGNKAVLSEEGSGSTFRLTYGDIFRLKIHNKSPADVYLTALNLSTDGRVDVFRQAEKKGDVLRAGETYLSPVYRATGLPGEDLFKFIASTKQFEFPGVSRGAELVRVWEEWGSTQIRLLVAAPSPSENVSQERLVEYINKNLHILAIGIDEHKDPQRQLKFSVLDAKAITSALNERGGEMYNVRSHLLVNEQATRNGIENAFKSVIAEIQPEDVFIFYNATYDYTGEEQADAPAEWFILPQDVVPSNEPKSDWRKNAISGELLRNWIAAMKSQNQVLIFDSSPLALERFVLGLSDDRKSAATMLKKNFVVFGGNGQEILEVEHGEFTYNLLNGLGGKAYFGLTRNQITVRDLQHFLRGAKPRQRGSKLFQSFSIGDDIALGAVPKEVAETTRDAGQDYEFHDPEAGRVKRQGKDYALFIATEVYDDKEFKEIKNPIRDAESLAAVLRDKYGFEVEVLKNKSKREIERVLETKYLDIAAGEDDQLFIFFSGHGNYVDRIKDGGIAVKDSTVNDINSYVRFRWLQERLETFSSPHVLVVVDACYSGSFFKDVLAGSKDTGTNRARMSDADYYNDRIKNRARKAITSAALKPSWDSIPGVPGSHSPLASELLLLLSKSVDVNYIAFDDIKGKIKTVKPGPVSGDFGGEPDSDFFFVPKRLPQN